MRRMLLFARSALSKPGRLATHAREAVGESSSLTAPRPRPVTCLPVFWTCVPTLLPTS